MTSEASFIELMRVIANDPAARGLVDDVAVIQLSDRDLILTHDMMVEGIHWLPNADPADVAWKLVSVNLSDLGSKGAKPLGVLLGFSLGSNDWDARFAAGLGEALAHYDVALLGGDTVSAGQGHRTIGMTAIGESTYRPVCSRSGARTGDLLYVTGTIGDAKGGFDAEKAGGEGSSYLRNAFNRPIALLAEGQVLAPFVTAMMDVSDGLLIDAKRMADASGLAIEIEMSDIPLSAEYVAHYGRSVESITGAATWGDDYQLLFAVSLGTKITVPATRIGRFRDGSGLKFLDRGTEINISLPLGYQHS